MFISRKKYERELEMANVRGFIEGLDKGYEYGRNSASIFEKYAVNDIRKAFGFPPIHNGKKTDSITVDESNKEESNGESN